MRNLIFIILIVSLLVSQYSSFTDTSDEVQITKPTMAYNIYFGNLHNHSLLSGGDMSAEEAYQKARDEVGLDFFSLADHDYDLTEEKYEFMINTSNSFYDPGTFTTFWGYEWSSSKEGHIAVINCDDYYASETTGFHELLDLLSQQPDVLAFFNHTGRSGNYEFDQFNSEPIPQFVGMELWNGNKGFDVYYYNDGFDDTDNGMGYYDEALLKGWKIGPMGAYDNHDLTYDRGTDYAFAVLAEENTRTSILDALKNRRFYASLDKDLKLSFTINEQPMGSIINSGTYPMEIGIQDTFDDTVLYVELIDNGIHIKTWEVNANVATIHSEMNFEAGHHYYVRIKESDGDEAVSSPIIMLNHDATINIHVDGTTEEISKTEPLPDEDIYLTDIGDHWAKLQISELIKTLLVPNSQLCW